MAECQVESMVGGTTPPQSDSGEISRVLVLNLLCRKTRRLFPGTRELNEKRSKSHMLPRNCTKRTNPLDIISSALRARRAYSSPWSAALRYQRTASAYSCGTPRP